MYGVGGSVVLASGRPVPDAGNTCLQVGKKKLHVLLCTHQGSQQKGERQVL